MQRSGFPTEEAAGQALGRALERTRQEQGLAQAPTLSELVEIYLAQHDTEPETLDKLRWLLSKATAAFGNTPISELQPAEITAWRMTIPSGHRFETTQALRQTLARAVSLGMINRNPAKQGVENRQRPRVEQRPFESWDELQRLADRLGRHLGPIVLFAAATGLRPSEWLALAPGWLRLHAAGSADICFGDSGSPSILSGTNLVLGITAVEWSLAGSECESGLWEQRVDTPAARAFLSQYVPLP